MPVIIEDADAPAVRRFLATLFGIPFVEAAAELAALRALVQQLIQQVHTMSDAFTNELTQLRSDVAAQSTVIASATTAFQGLAAQIAAAERAAKDKGATDDQVAGIAAVRQGLEANTAALAAAIPANTSAASNGGGDTPAAPTTTVTPSVADSTGAAENPNIEPPAPNTSAPTV